MRRTSLLLVIAALCLLAARSGADEVIDYLDDVRPILARRCVSCHGAERPRGGLRLDTAGAALAGGDSGPAVVPGRPEESELLLAVLGEGATERMPLDRPPLPNEEVATLRRWIASGAPGPATDAEEAGAAAEHWSFRPPVPVAPPSVVNGDWPRNPIDRFILAALEPDGLAPSPEADRATLIRRLSLDLIGLPPSPEEVEAFVADDAPDAYERLVDRLLGSPHYGERWGRIWLDGARYADSNGYSIDAPRSIWPYRDWVIGALNRDQPFDEFTVDQLAGDLRPGAKLAQKVATGFHRNTPINQEGGIDVEQFRVESVIDRVDTTGTVWLGLTIGCARCHDHKYDPITQLDYYRLFAFLNTVDEPDLPVASPEVVAKQDEVNGQIDAYLGSIEREPALLDAQRGWEAGLDMAARQAQSQEVRTAFDTIFDQRPPALNRPAFAAFVEQADIPETKPHREALAGLRAELPKIPTTMVVRERATPRETHLLLGGDFTRPGDLVSPDVPTVLPPLEAAPGKVPDRLDLARWIVDPDNPLTARVVVNRLWMHHFGRGVVETDEDLGTQGSRPSHPELLDWLALEFIRGDWSLKAIHRLMVTSATYRQSSRVRPELAAVDPDNRRYARQSRPRLDAELVRDSALVASGLLTPAIGGPSVFPPQPDGVMTLGQMRRAWEADTGPDRYRRGMYTFFWRATPHPLLVGFDAPDATRACTRRVRSNTPVQALMLLNDLAFFECARALADRVLDEGPVDDPGRLDFAFRLCLARGPDPVERGRLAALLSTQMDRYRDDPEAARALIADPAASDPVGRAAWTTVARVLLNLDEFVTRE